MMGRKQIVKEDTGIQKKGIMKEKVVRNSANESHHKKQKDVKGTDK